MIFMLIGNKKSKFLVLSNLYKILHALSFPHLPLIPLVSCPVLLPSGCCSILAFNWSEEMSQCSSIFIHSVFFFFLFKQLFSDSAHVILFIVPGFAFFSKKQSSKSMSLFSGKIKLLGCSNHPHQITCYSTLYLAIIL